MKSEDKYNRRYFDCVSTFGLLAYIALGIWHWTNQEMVFWIGAVMALISLALVGLSFSSVGSFSILEPMKHKPTVVMSGLISVIYAMYIVSV